MNSERNILKRLLESSKYEDNNSSDKELDEKTYTIGDTQYWKRSGKYYKWTASTGKTEVSEDEYYKALSSGESVKNTDPGNDKAKDTPSEEPKNEPKKESPYSKYGFTKKPTEKMVGSIAGKYITGDEARDITYVLTNRNGEMANIVNHDKQYGDKPGTFEGSVDRMMKDPKIRSYYQGQLEDGINKVQKHGTEEEKNMINYIKDKWDEYVKNTDPSNKSKETDDPVSKQSNSTKDKLEYSGPTKKVIQGKTFKVDTSSGKPVIRASMYDTNERLSKLNKFAKENGITIEYEESKKKSEPMVDKGKKYKDMYAKATADYEKSQTSQDKSELDKINRHSAKRAGEYMSKLYHDAMHPNDKSSMPKGMRSVQFSNGEGYRVDSKSGSDFIQINPTGKGKYELVVYDNGSLVPTDKKQNISKEDAFKLAKDTMDKSEYYKTGKVSFTDKRRNEFYDDSESDYVNYDGVKNFDHTTWDIDGYETTIKRNDSGKGYYLQNEDFDMEFDTKGDLVDYLKDNEASFAGYDSEKDY